MNKRKEQQKKKNDPQKTPVTDPTVGFPAGRPDEITDPPTPNRAWTEMKLGSDIDVLSEEEKAELYLGPDSFF